MHKKRAATDKIGRPRSRTANKKREMRVIERIKQAQLAMPAPPPEQGELLSVLEQIFIAANPSEDAEDLLLEWFFNTRRAQIRQLRADGMNALAKTEEQKLGFLRKLRKYVSYDGTLLRPGERFYVSDRENPQWDFAGNVLGYDKDSYTVSMDGPDGRRNPPETMTADEIRPDPDVEKSQANYAQKWTNSPLIRLLDLSPIARAELGKRLSVFLCHATEDRVRIRELYSKLKLDGFRPWLDMEALVPGEEWENRIRADIRASDIVLACLSVVANGKVGFVRAEMDIAWEAASQRSDGHRYLIPILLEPCDIPERLARWHAVRLFEPDGYSKLVAALRERGQQLDRSID